MSTLMNNGPKASSVSVTNDALTVNLTDGRTIIVPIGWFPRLLYGSVSERENWRLIGNGTGIHWEELDEDIFVEGLLAGKRSEESQESFKKWLKGHSKAAA